MAAPGPLSLASLLAGRAGALPLPCIPRCAHPHPRLRWPRSSWKFATRSPTTTSGGDLHPSTPRRCTPTLLEVLPGSGCASGFGTIPTYSWSPNLASVVPGGQHWSRRSVALLPGRRGIAQLYGEEPQWLSGRPHRVLVCIGHGAAGSYFCGWPGAAIAWPVDPLVFNSVQAWGSCQL